MDSSSSPLESVHGPAIGFVLNVTVDDEVFSSHTAHLANFDDFSDFSRSEARQLFSDAIAAWIQSEVAKKSKALQDGFFGSIPAETDLATLSRNPPPGKQIVDYAANALRKLGGKSGLREIYDQMVQDGWTTTATSYGSAMSTIRLALARRPNLFTSEDGQYLYAGGNSESSPDGSSQDDNPVDVKESNEAPAESVSSKERPRVGGRFVVAGMTIPECLDRAFFIVDGPATVQMLYSVIIENPDIDFHTEGGDPIKVLRKAMVARPNRYKRIDDDLWAAIPDEQSVQEQQPDLAKNSIAIASGDRIDPEKSTLAEEEYLRARRQDNSSTDSAPQTADVKNLELASA